MESILNIWRALFPANPRIVVHPSQEAMLKALDDDAKRMDERRRHDLSTNLFQDF